MAWIDDISDKSKDVMEDPDLRARIEEVARNQGISFEEARDQVMKNHN